MPEKMDSLANRPPAGHGLNKGFPKFDAPIPHKKIEQELLGLEPAELKKIIAHSEEVMELNSEDFDINSVKKRMEMSRRRIALGMLGNEGLDIIEKKMNTENSRIIGWSDLDALMAHGNDALSNWPKGSDDLQKQELENMLKRARELMDEIDRLDDQEVNAA